MAFTWPLSSAVQSGQLSTKETCLYREMVLGFQYCEKSYYKETYSTILGNLGFENLQKIGLTVSGRKPITITIYYYYYYYSPFSLCAN